MEIVYENFAKTLVLLVWLACLITSFKQRDSSVYLYAVGITILTGVYKAVNLLFVLAGR